jgi:ankyrin repeat protein
MSEKEAQTLLPQSPFPTFLNHHPTLNARPSHFRWCIQLSHNLQFLFLHFHLFCIMFVSHQFLRSALHYAAREGHYNVACVLLEAEGVVVDSRNNVGLTPLHYACRDGHASVAELLLEHGAQPTAVDMHGWQPLHLACEHGGHNTMSLLLALSSSSPDQGLIDLNVCGEFGKTPLHVAAKAGHTGACSLLLGAGADVEAKNHAGGTALHYAARDGRQVG